MRPNDRHAAYRAATRTEGVSIEDLRRRILAGEFEYLRRQTRTRTICKTVVEAEDVYFIFDKVTSRIVTVLTEDQAQEHLASPNLLLWGQSMSCGCYL